MNLAIVIFPKYFLIGYKLDASSIWLVGLLQISITNYFSFAKRYSLRLTFARTYHSEVRRKCINSLNTNTVKSYRLLKCFRVVFGTSIHLGTYIFYLSKWYTSTIVLYFYTFIFNNNLNCFPETHHILIY